MAKYLSIMIMLKFNTVVHYTVLSLVLKCYMGQFFIILDWWLVTLLVVVSMTT